MISYKKKIYKFFSSLFMYHHIDSTSEKYFKKIGVYSFLDGEEDLNVDWEEVFGIKEEQVA